MVVHFVPAHRVVAVLESLTGAAPSVEFVQGMLARTAGGLTEVHNRIRTLITLSSAVACDQTPLKVGPKTPKVGKKKAERYLLVACTELDTHYLLGDRSLDTFKAFVLAELGSAVIVHDRYQNYDSAQLGVLVHQLCCQHLLRDLADAAEVYPDAVWPVQIADALRGLIHQANLAREAGHDTIPTRIRDELIARFRHGVLVGLSPDHHRRHPPRPAQGPAAAGSPARPRHRCAALRPRPHGAAHLEPSRTRPTPQQGPAEHLRAPNQRRAHSRPLHHPRLPLYRRQTRPQPTRRLARRADRPTLDTGTTHTHLTTPTEPPTTGGHPPTSDHAMPPNLG